MCRCSGRLVLLPPVQCGTELLTQVQVWIQAMTSTKTCQSGSAAEMKDDLRYAEPPKPQEALGSDYHGRLTISKTVSSPLWSWEPLCKEEKPNMSGNVSSILTSEFHESASDHQHHLIGLSHTSPAESSPGMDGVLPALTRRLCLPFTSLLLTPNSSRTRRSVRVFLRRGQSPRKALLQRMPRTAFRCSGLA